MCKALQMNPEKGRSKPRIPRWRGFNLTELADGKRGRRYEKFDFECMADWGFNFARLPCSYWTWSDRDRWMTISDAALEPLDQAVELGQRYGIHTNIALHRIPGYCVNGRELEPYQLFDSPRQSKQLALEAAEYHWAYLSQRYKDVPTGQLSFDLLNEPPFMTDQTRYVEIARVLIDTIRKANPDRIIFADGSDIGQTPVLGLADQGIVQSTRGYLPKMVSHFTADYVPLNEFESFKTPTWPMTDDSGVLWNKEMLRQRLIAEWQPLVKMDVPIHVSEWGCLNKTPHVACLDWMTDLLALWKEVGWGWSMWNLRGRFGILDSGRTDVEYESFHGHMLDRKMFELLIAN
jgi:endoglucanase